MVILWNVDHVTCVGVAIIMTLGTSSMPVYPVLHRVSRRTGRNIFLVEDQQKASVVPASTGNSQQLHVFFNTCNEIYRIELFDY